MHIGSALFFSRISVFPHLYLLHLSWFYLALHSWYLMYCIWYLLGLLCYFTQSCMMHCPYIILKCCTLAYRILYFIFVWLLVSWYPLFCINALGRLKQDLGSDGYFCYFSLFGCLFCLCPCFCPLSLLASFLHFPCLASFIQVHMIFPTVCYNLYSKYFCYAYGVACAYFVWFIHTPAIDLFIYWSVYISCLIFTWTALDHILFNLIYFKLFKQ